MHTKTQPVYRILFRLLHTYYKKILMWIPRNQKFEEEEKKKKNGEKKRHSEIHPPPSLTYPHLSPFFFFFHCYVDNPSTACFCNKRIRTMTKRIRTTEYKDYVPVGMHINAACAVVNLKQWSCVNDHYMSTMNACQQWIFSDLLEVFIVANSKILTKRMDKARSRRATRSKARLGCTLWRELAEILSLT